MIRTDDDSFDDDLFDDDGEDAGGDLLICPHCRAEVHEDTQKCPHCGDWITPVYPAERGKRWLWTAAALLVVIAFLLMALL
jgi:uncharacterized paraquat-inducible protein A